MTCAPTILLLDDEPLLLRATALLLSRSGGRVTQADAVDEALALAGERVYDVAVLDLSPPRPSAVEVVRRMRAQGIGPRRVIAVSGEALLAADAAELDVVLPRPYPFDALLQAVFGAGQRRRTRSGVFPSIRSGAVRPLTWPSPRGAARAGRGHAG